MNKPILCLTLWQPWATLVALGAKCYETRSWKTPYRGVLVIHAARRFDAQQQLLCREEIFREVLSAAGYHHPMELPLGKALCTVVMKGAFPTEALRNRISAQERRFGDWSDGRQAWELCSVYRFPKPIPIQGAQGMWPWPPTIPLPEAT
jgi:hypothetical protein